jgi:hypothetical protein
MPQRTVASHITFARRNRSSLPVHQAVPAVALTGVLYAGVSEAFLEAEVLTD